MVRVTIPQTIARADFAPVQLHMLEDIVRQVFAIETQQIVPLITAPAPPHTLVAIVQEDHAIIPQTTVLLDFVAE